MNILHDRPQEPERSYNRAYWESLHDHDEIEEPENELHESNEPITAPPEGEVLQRRKPDYRGSQFSEQARARGLTEAEYREMRG